jgi:hypothetical protein
MANDLNTPSELRLDPMPATAGVALVNPEMLEAWELLICAFQQQRHAGAVLNVRCVHFGAKNKATSVDENVTFAAVDTLGTVVPAYTANTSRAN